MLGLDFIRRLKPCRWDYNGNLDDGVKHLGFLAQDIEAMADMAEYAIVRRTEHGFLCLEMTEFIAPIVKAIQELDAEITRLKEGKNNGDISHFLLGNKN